MKIQAVLFNKDKYSHKDAIKWLKENKHDYISYRLTDNFRRYRLIEPNYKKYIYKYKKINNYISFIIEINK